MPRKCVWSSFQIPANMLHGHPLTEDPQWRTLERVVEVAREVWGE